MITKTLTQQMLQEQPTNHNESNFLLSTSDCSKTTNAPDWGAFVVFVSRFHPWRNRDTNRIKSFFFNTSPFLVQKVLCLTFIDIYTYKKVSYRVNFPITTYNLQ